MKLTIEKYINSPILIKDELTFLFNRFHNLIILDIGACEGEDSIRYSKLFPNSKIFAFEPVEENLKSIEINLKKFNIKNVEIVPYALDNKTGETLMHLSEGRPEFASEDDIWDYGNKSSSILPPEKVTEVHNWLIFKKIISIPTKTLKSFCKENDINKIDFIHLDVQGAELKVLEGAGELLNKTSAIWLEVEKIPFYKGQPLKKEVETFMNKNNFIKVKDNVTGLSGDQLYINKSFYCQSTVKRLKLLNKNNLFVKLKNRLSFKNAYSKKSFSQCGEDLIIKFIFDTLQIKNPSWIDIGANHPFKFNNTALFYNDGNTGINIEADPGSIADLKKFRPNDYNINVGISDSIGKLPFYIMSSNTLNTFSLEEANKLVALNYNIIKTIEIETTTLSKIISQYSFNQFPELLAIDVEGYEDVILKSIDFDNNYPIVICVETISFSEKGLGIKNYELIEFIKSKGYLYYADTYINSIFVRQELWLQS